MTKEIGGATKGSGGKKGSGLVFFFNQMPAALQLGFGQLLAHVVLELGIALSGTLHMATLILEPWVCYCE